MFISRRSLLKTGAAAALASPLWSLAQTTAATRKLILSAPLTHSDWMLKPGIEWGPAGVRHMLDVCKACGWSRVYWRTFDGGRTTYSSKVARPFNDWDEDNFWNPQNDADRKVVDSFHMDPGPVKKAEMLAKFKRMDYSKFDALAEAVRYGHEIGLQIHAWVTINEDDHGWGISSDFARKHPEFRWRKRDGTPYHSQLSFAFPQVREYKLSIIRELAAGYRIDGLFLDWIRTGDVRDNPQNDAEGVANYGYELPLVDAFKSKFNLDPHAVPNGDERWVRVRAEPQTLFMREVRKTTRLPIAVMVGHPWHYRGMMDKIDGNLRGLLLDVGTWANEGLMDHAVAAGYYRDGGDATKVYRALKDETHGKVDVWTYEWVPRSVAEFSSACDVADTVGAKQILFWEADYIDDRANAAELKAAMQARAAIN